MSKRRRIVTHEVSPINLDCAEVGNSNQPIIDLTKSDTPIKASRKRARIRDREPGQEHTERDHSIIIISDTEEDTNVINTSERTNRTSSKLTSVNQHWSSPSSQPLNSVNDNTSPSPVIECPICKESYSQIKKTRTLQSTVCGHIFCSSCLKIALKRKNECPICRKKVLAKNVHDVYI
ncbi:uncharacterized protein TRIADDRAFT_58523 [Trichoplax adhaerens]|uniref:RING-type domain-containing protein n=1 Tax=Trichoplax adhaerens TaxID=10228 RepID=B3S2X9_TRIAD|nr:hypothetical protein TRIADDRAFT_58523 [Trichoplax adhaerens]EDV22867.1 hypothetical protein TRIADDRAFT_58523 [Trichoplax adhaerens]|eukprot:XP_002114733.1 hypothetical protein TRIADDRAFT_58523 [Trichoplax adhaerens]